MSNVFRQLRLHLPTLQQISEAPMLFLQKIDERTSLPVVTFIAIIMLMAAMSRYY